MMVDFGYRWRDWRDALWVLNRLADCNLYFAEATLQHDDLVGHSKLASRCETRVGGAEMAVTVYECREWLERGGVDVLQPDIGRCGGLTELRRIAQLAEALWSPRRPARLENGDHGRRLTSLSSCDSQCALHRDAVPFGVLVAASGRATAPEPEVFEGTLALPTAPGLGIELVEEAVRTYRVPSMSEWRRSPCEKGCL